MRDNDKDGAGRAVLVSPSGSQIEPGDRLQA